MVNQAFCTLGKVWLAWFENQRSLVVQPGLHPGKPWFNQAFGAREFTAFSQDERLKQIIWPRDETCACCEEEKILHFVRTEINFP